MAFGLKNVVNEGATTLSSALYAGGYACTIVDGASLPTSNFWLTIEGPLGTGREIVLVESRIANLLTLAGRGEQGTLESDHPAGSLVRALFTAGHYGDLNDLLGLMLHGPVVDSEYILVQNAAGLPRSQTLSIDAYNLFYDYGYLAALEGDCIAIGGQPRGVLQGVSRHQEIAIDRDISKKFHAPGSGDTWISVAEAENELGDEIQWIHASDALLERIRPIGGGWGIVVTSLAELREVAIDPDLQDLFHYPAAGGSCIVVNDDHTSRRQVIALDPNVSQYFHWPATGSVYIDVNDTNGQQVVSASGALLDLFDYLITGAGTAYHIPRFYEERAIGDSSITFIPEGGDEPDRYDFGGAKLQGIKELWVSEKIDVEDVFARRLLYFDAAAAVYRRVEVPFEGNCLYVGGRDRGNVLERPYGEVGVDPAVSERFHDVAAGSLYIDVTEDVNTLNKAVQRIAASQTLIDKLHDPASSGNCVVVDEHQVVNVDPLISCYFHWPSAGSTFIDVNNDVESHTQVVALSAEALRRFPDCALANADYLPYLERDASSPFYVRLRDSPIHLTSGSPDILSFNDAKLDSIGEMWVTGKVDAGTGYFGQLYARDPNDENTWRRALVGTGGNGHFAVWGPTDTLVEGPFTLNSVTTTASFGNWKLDSIAELWVTDKVDAGVGYFGQLFARDPNDENTYRRVPVGTGSTGQIVVWGPSETLIQGAAYFNLATSTVSFGNWKLDSIGELWTNSAVHVGTDLWTSGKVECGTVLYAGSAHVKDVLNNYQPVVMGSGTEGYLAAWVNNGDQADKLVNSSLRVDGSGNVAVNSSGTGVRMTLGSQNGIDMIVSENNFRLMLGGANGIDLHAENGTFQINLGGAGGAAIHVGGNVYADDFVPNSHESLKAEIADLEPGLGLRAVRAIRPRTYHLRADAWKEARLGVVVEECPPAVLDRNGDLSLYRLVTVTLAALKELDREVDTRLGEVERRLAKLEK